MRYSIVGTVKGQTLLQVGLDFLTENAIPIIREHNDFVGVYHFPNHSFHPISSSCIAPSTEITLPYAYARRLSFIAIKAERFNRGSSQAHNDATKLQIRSGNDSASKRSSNETKPGFVFSRKWTTALQIWESRERLSERRKAAASDENS